MRVGYGDTVLGVECAIPHLRARRHRSLVRRFLGRLTAALKRWG